jgi:predicted metal-dependent phosphotriesterase family hydrolase
MFIDRLLENGFSERDLRVMVRDNPAQLLGAKTSAAVAA